jgi:ribonuclease-3
MSTIRLSQQLGHDFSQPNLLRQALTHRSFGATNNERFEFLGDSVLNCVIAQYLFDHYPKLSEGDLSRVRANLVNQQTLSEIAETLELGKQLRLGEGELKSGGQKRPSILADAVEAIFGAVLLDAGFNVAASVVLRLYQPILSKLDPSNQAKDPKTRLQELLQGRRLALPQYLLTGTSGDAHEQLFSVECVIEPLNIRTKGKGSNRRMAEQQAATQAFEQARERLQS